MSSTEELKKLLLDHGEGDNFSLPQVHPMELGTCIRLDVSGWQKATKLMAQSYPLWR